MALIEVSDEKLRAAGATALLDSLTPEQREGLLKGAIEHLMEKEFTSSRWSKMQSIFDDALRDAAHKLADEELAKPERREQLLAIIVSALDKLFTNPEVTKKASERLANDLGTAMFGNRFDR